MADKAEFPEEKPPKFSPSDDIPEAVRDTPDSQANFQLKPVHFLGGLAGLGAIALLVGVLSSLFGPKSPSISATPLPTPSASPPNTGEINVLGHLPYKEAPQKQLESITADGRIKMRQAAAKKFKAMVAAARSQGVIIVPLSGFRSVSEQDGVFFRVKAQRNQEVSKRAEVSAPPGYSEHHTGYAVDIGDGKVPAANLKQSFEKTQAFKWMDKNAPKYQFELSFPKNNPQGVSYEPWHWRFVGDRASLETFYRAKNLK